MADSRRHIAREILPLDAVTDRGFLDLPTLITVLLFDLQVDKASEEHQEGYLSAEPVPIDTLYGTCGQRDQERSRCPYPALC
jgi:hypothetical protein